MAVSAALLRRAALGLALGLTASLAEARAARADGALFDLAGFFAGRSVSAGEVRTLFFSLEPFTAGFQGRVEGDTLQLDERFRFPEGERLQRWHLRFAGPLVRGTVETEGRDGQLRPAVPVEGERTATGVELRYTGFAPGGRALRLAFRHVMTANGDGTLENHVTVRLLGVPLARSEVTFSKSEADLQRHLAKAPHP
ncbi:hypothetical protein M673_01295 [Aureimonas sp. AU20]|nr:hypothetical protein M673_01295 [Aureimonas sp. AU20]